MTQATCFRPNQSIVGPIQKQITRIVTNSITLDFGGLSGPGHESSTIVRNARTTHPVTRRHIPEDLNTH